MPVNVKRSFSLKEIAVSIQPRLNTEDKAITSFKDFLLMRKTEPQSTEMMMNGVKKLLVWKMIR